MSASVLAALVILCSAGAAPTAAPGSLGAAVSDFSLRDCRGKEYRLASWKDQRFLVVAFVGTQCPLAKLYGPRLAQLAAAYSPRGVAFVGIDSNETDSLSALRAYARRHGIAFPLLRDPGAEVADLFAAERTPEVFVLDQERRIRYRGRIDDQNDVRTHRAVVKQSDLALALDELLAGKPVSHPRTQTTGCVISRPTPAQRNSRVTYCRDIAPIVQQHCQVCHRRGEIGPLTLTSYREVAGWAGMIREVVSEGRMPPWHASPKYGHFANDPSLSKKEKDLLLGWIEDGCPEGKRADLPPPRQFVEGWNIGEPDAVLRMPQPFRVPAEGVIEYQYIVIDPGAPVDRWVQGAEVRPGNREVVHHCNVFLQPPGASDFQEQGALGSFCLAALAPGTPPMILPEGLAKRIPAGWRMVLVMHYTTVGSVQTDQTCLGLKFADVRKVKQEVATRLMFDLQLCIPPGIPDHTVAQTWKINRDVLLLAFFPHMHLRGKSFRYDAIYPNGTEETLLDVPSWDFNWQHRYVLAEPKKLPAGSQLRCTAVFDNSSANPANPDPSATVRAGTQSWDEMFNGYYDVVLADQDLTQGTPLRDTLGELHQRFFRTGVGLSAVLACGLIVLRRARRKT